MPDFNVPDIPDTYRLTPEFKLLTACSWIAPPLLEQDQVNKIVSSCRPEIDWSIFQTLVNYHEVQALVYENLWRHANACVPDKIMSALKESKTQISIRSLQQGSELLALVRKFTDQGVELLPLKGVLLSIQLYGDPGMRNSCDLDIMVTPENVENACQILISEGYACTMTGTALTPRQRDYLKTYFHHLEFSHPGKNMFVELHWSFGSLWSSEHVAVMWNRIQPIEWMGCRLETLDEASQVLFLCDHGARHGFYSLKWLSDIARLLSNEPLQGWKSLLDLAGDLDLKRTLAHSALLAHWIYGVPLAQVLLDLIRADHKAVSISTTVYSQLLSRQDSTSNKGKPPGSLKLAWQKLRLKPSLPIRMALRPKLVAVFDFIDFPLPDRLFWLYYPMRPVTLVWRHFFKK